MEQDEGDLSSLTRQELIEKIQSLERQVAKLTQPSVVKKEYKNQKPFDFSKYSKVHIALKFLYLGWKFDGFVKQENYHNTIEDHIFNALTIVKLIESRETSNYHRCGRTDIGVSAFSQVISLTVRGLPLDNLIEMKDGKKKIKREPLNYPKLLNSVLPPEIRVIAFAEVSDEFSARFTCCRRMYKYIFPRGSLDILKMQQAAAFLVGEHDFKNFCKLDKNKLTTVRHVYRAEIENHKQFGREEVPHFMVFTIVSNAFLWHQIRCIVEVLFLVGEGKEEPSIVQDLLDTSKYPLKPLYSLACGLPLNLFDTEFSQQIEWKYDKPTVQEVTKTLHNLWTQHSIKSHMIDLMITKLSLDTGCQSSLNSNHLIGERANLYKPLKDRQVEGKKDSNTSLT